MQVRWNQPTDISRLNRRLLLAPSRLMHEGGRVNTSVSLDACLHDTRQDHTRAAPLPRNLWTFSPIDEATIFIDWLSRL